MKLCYILDNSHKQTLNIGDDLYFLINKFESDHINVLLSEINNNPSEIDAFIIPCSLGSIHTKYSGIKVGFHIRLSRELGNKRFLPIIFVSADEYRIMAIFDEENILKFALSKGCRLIKYSGIMYPEKLKVNISKCINDGFDLSKSESELEHDLRVSVLNLLNLSVPYGKDSHSIANDWGMTRFGFLINYVNFRTQDLFTKYLLAKTEADTGSIKERDKTTKKWIDYLNHNTLKVLFIDNDAQKGWNSYIKKFFDIQIAEYYLEFDNYENANRYFNMTKIEIKRLPDIILLDLRLEEADDKIILPKNIAEYSGGKLLITIKKTFPFIPVIIFTASNKAWNIEALLQEGADGYYIKESPDYGINNKYSIYTFKRFTSNLIKVIEKAKYLKKIWNSNYEIIKNLHKSIDNEIIRSSIDQKLNMAFAILNSHQTNYEINNYVYNEFEFAFLVYWSILSEIIADKFKINAIKKGKTTIHTWKIKKENCYYIKENRSKLINQKFAGEEHKRMDKPKYYLVNSEIEIDANNYTKTISLQIVYLILASKEYKAFNKPSKDQEFIFKLIDETNEQRNKLDLTHPDLELLEKEVFNNRRNSTEISQKRYLENVLKLIYVMLNKEFLKDKIFDQ